MKPFNSLCSCIVDTPLTDLIAHRSEPCRHWCFREVYLLICTWKMGLLRNSSSVSFIFSQANLGSGDKSAPTLPKNLLFFFFLMWNHAFSLVPIIFISTLCSYVDIYRSCHWILLICASEAISLWYLRKMSVAKENLDIFTDNYHIFFPWRNITKILSLVSKFPLNQPVKQEFLFYPRWVRNHIPIWIRHYRWQHLKQTISKPLSDY